MPHLISRIVLAVLTTIAVTVSASAHQARPLPALEVELNQTTVSGISSGAYMAGQLQFAHARIVKGIAIIAGGPFGCAQSASAHVMPGPAGAVLNLSKAINGCMKNTLAFWGIPNPKSLVRKARDLAKNNKIDPITDVLPDRVYLFSGKSDHIVVPAIVESAQRFYLELGLRQGQISRVTTLNAGHGFVTENNPNSCTRTGKPYIVDCDYDQAGELLSFLYGSLNPKSSDPSGTLISYDQLAFTKSRTGHGLAETGYAYVPAVCNSGKKKCRVHIALHGCNQNHHAVGDTFMRATGFDHWADTNALVILFPQTAAGTLDNPQGCWDWWGYTGRDYLTREAPQIAAIHNMLQRLAAPRRSKLPQRQPIQPARP